MHVKPNCLDSESHVENTLSDLYTLLGVHGDVWVEIIYSELYRIFIVASG